MFIRKKTRKNKRREDTFDFVVVASHRTPQGPRSKVLCHLGTIEARFIEHPKYGRCHHVYLWESRTMRSGEHRKGAREKIRDIVVVHIPEPEREKVIEGLILGLAKPVAEPTQEDIGQIPAAAAALVAQINARINR
jgi:hypothetical protein